MCRSAWMRKFSWANLCDMWRKCAGELVAGDVDTDGRLYKLFPVLGIENGDEKNENKIFLEIKFWNFFFGPFVICICFPEHDGGESVSEWPSSPDFDNSYFIVTYAHCYKDGENGRWYIYIYICVSHKKLILKNLKLYNIHFVSGVASIYSSMFNFYMISHLW